jgi:arsenate reductase
MSKYTILHNPRCRKSRETLALLEKEGIEPKIILYLENPPTKKRLKEIAKLLNKKPIEFIRTHEKPFAELGLSKDDSDEALFVAMTEHPILIERPIVIKNNKEAIIGRPPENIFDII